MQLQQQSLHNIRSSAFAFSSSSTAAVPESSEYLNSLEYTGLGEEEEEEEEMMRFLFSLSNPICCCCCFCLKKEKKWIGGG